MRAFKRVSKASSCTVAVCCPLKISVASLTVGVGLATHHTDKFGHAHCFLPIAYALSYYIGMFEFGIRFRGRGWEAAWGHAILRGLYCNASAMWCTPMTGVPSKSAMVRATFSTR